LGYGTRQRYQEPCRQRDLEIAARGRDRRDVGLGLVQLLLGRLERAFLLGRRRLDVLAALREELVGRRRLRRGLRGGLRRGGRFVSSVIATGGERDGKTTGDEGGEESGHGGQG